MSSRIARRNAGQSGATALDSPVVAELPRGTVTFLFTDVENSTRLVKQLGERYAGLLSDHRRLVRAAFEVEGGYEIECRADEFFIAFQNARSAVAAAVAVQRALAAHPWPDGAEVRVRMGIHTGEPTFEDDTYLGLDVHRAARICSAGHGGQVLVSEATRMLLSDGAAGDIRFQDLGEHELRGLDRPERLYQLVSPGLPASFPPLRLSGGKGLERAFVGREREPRRAADEAEPVPAADGPAAPAERREKQLRIVLADDSVLLREGMARLLDDAGFEIVAQAGTAEELLRAVGAHDPDVAIVDIRMPPSYKDEGLRAAQQIRTEHADVAVLVLSQYVEPAYAMDLLAESAEGVGYLLKDRVSDVEEFAAAVRRVGEGGSALDPAIVSQLVGRRRRHDPLDELTARERDVLELMAEGRSNQGIAERLVVTERAVEKHVTSIFGKLRLPPAPEDHRRVLAVLAFLRS